MRRSCYFCYGLLTLQYLRLRLVFLLLLAAWFLNSLYFGFVPVEHREIIFMFCNTNQEKFVGHLFEIFFQFGMTFFLCSYIPFNFHVRPSVFVYLELTLYVVQIFLSRISSITYIIKYDEHFLSNKSSRWCSLEMLEFKPT